MAKTNDGNLLQHFVECHVAFVLSDADAFGTGTRDLHLVCTHAMAPFEPGERSADDPQAQRLHRALGRAAPDAAVPLLRAYARTKAAFDHYPNTAELVAAVVGEAHLSGALCEKDEIHASVLANRWAPTAVSVRTGNWRSARAGTHLEPPTPERPWLFALDPYPWLLPREVNKASVAPQLCAPDLESLRPLWGRYANGSMPGAVVLTVYGLDDEHAADFRRRVIAVADRLGLERSFLGIDGGAGHRHLSALLSPTPGLAARVAEAWIHFRGEVEAG